MKYLITILTICLLSCVKTSIEPIPLKPAPVGDALFPTGEMIESFKTMPGTQTPKPKNPKPNHPRDTVVIINPPPTPTDTIYANVVYLDLDGHQTQAGTFWRDGLSWYSQPSTMDAAKKAQVLARAKIFYAAYRVTVTDNVQIFNQANPLTRIRVVITPTSAWWPGVSGGAFVGSFDWGDDTPAFVFENRLFYIPDYVAVIVAHEAGHSLGLVHEYEYVNCTLTQQAPNKIMGYPFTALAWWSTEEYTTFSCNNFQNGHQHLSNKLLLR